MTNFIYFDQHFEVVEKFSEVERLSRSRNQNPISHTSSPQQFKLSPLQLSMNSASSAIECGSRQLRYLKVKRRSSVHLPRRALPTGLVEVGGISVWQNSLKLFQNEIRSNPYSGWMSSTHSTIQVLKDQQLVATELSHPPLKCTSAPLRVSLSYSISTSSYSVQLSGVGLIRGFTTKKLKFLNPECATSTSGSILRSHFPTQQSTHLETSSNRQLQFEVEAERKDRN